MKLFYPYNRSSSNAGKTYKITTPDDGGYPIAIIKVKPGQAVSIVAKVAMKSTDQINFAEFITSNVFINNGGVISSKNQADPVTNRDNINNKFDFNIIGEEVHINCFSGLVKECKWVANVATIPV